MMNALTQTAFGTSVRTKIRPTSAVPVQCKAIPEQGETRQKSSRRDLMQSLVMVPLVASGIQAFEAAGPLVLPANAGKGAATRTAGDFCPPSTKKDGYVVYQPDSRATPSIRAGVIKGNPELYSFELPANWSEGTILNISSGNFCMPKCDEPWVETLWESKEDGFCQLVVSPIYRLVSKSNATLKDLGPPEQVIESVGAFVTGNYLDSVEDVSSMSQEKFSDGQDYYTYELYAPYAKTGSHFLAAITVKVRCGVPCLHGRLVKQQHQNAMVHVHVTH